MISGGNATIMVSKMDPSIHFYCEVLGLKLTTRYGNDWATVSAPDGLTLGLHPVSPNYPPPGAKGAIMLGLNIDLPIEQALSRLTESGVAIPGSILRSDAGNFLHLEDPDGNELYLWEKPGTPAPEPEMSTATVP